MNTPEDRGFSGYQLCRHSWWRHQMETFSASLAICAENSPVTGEFPAQRPVTRSFDVFDLRWSKQSLGWWFQTPWRPLWRHCNGWRHRRMSLWCMACGYCALDWPTSQIPQCIRQISHNAPFCNRNVHTRAHLCYKMVHCVVGYGSDALWDLGNNFRNPYFRTGYAQKAGLTEIQTYVY